MNSNFSLEHITHKQLKQALFRSQFFFFILAIFLSLFLFDHFSDWKRLFAFDPWEFFIYGLIPAIMIILLNLLIKYLIPKAYLDDGGINEKLFKNSTVLDIFMIAFVVAISEEVLFRGLLQTSFGLIIASTIFALVHFRYLKRPILLVSIVIISFYLGFLFKITGNLFVTIIVHFIVNFILGIIIRFEK